MGRLAEQAEPGGVFERSDSPNCDSLHTKALFMAEPDGDLAEYSGAKADQARVLHVGR